MKYFLLLLSLFVFGNTLFAQTEKSKIEFKATAFKNNKYYLAGYYGKYTTLLDSATANSSGRIAFEKDTKYTEGIYMLVDKDKKIVTEFVMDADQHFNIAVNLENPSKSVIDHSPLNLDFQAFNSLLKEKTEAMNTLNGTLAQQKTNKDSLEVRAKIGVIQKEITKYKSDYLQKNPHNLISLLFELSLPVENYFDLKEEAVLLKTKKDSLDYVKQRYFSAIDFSDPRLLRNPFLENKIDGYFNSLVVQTPEAISPEVFAILDKTGSREGDLFKYLSLFFVNKYVAPKIMGLDKVFLNINDHYFKGKEYSWLELEQKEFLKRMDRILKSNQIGALAPNLFMNTVAGTRIDLYDVNAPYTVLAFWDPTCGHCATEIPKMKKVYTDLWKSKGIKVFAININNEEKVKWVEFIAKEKLEDWINVSPATTVIGNYTKEEVDFQTLYNVSQTPVFYLLDANKKILAKKVGFESYLDIIGNQEKQLKH